MTSPYPAIPTAAEFMSSGGGSTDWLIEPFIARGALTVIAGPPKEAGKTTLLLQMVKCLLSGAPFAGRAIGRCPAAIYVSEEDSTFRAALRRARFTQEHCQMLSVLS